MLEILFFPLVYARFFRESTLEFECSCFSTELYGKLVISVVEIKFGMATGRRQFDWNFKNFFSLVSNQE